MVVTLRPYAAGVGLPDLRFTRGDMHSTLAKQRSAVGDAVRGLMPDRVLNTPIEDLADELFERFRIRPIVLDLPNRTSSGANDVTLSLDSWTGDRVKVDGTRVEVLIPFQGDAVLFDAQASTYTYNPPRFATQNGAVVVSHEDRAPLDTHRAKSAIEDMITTIQKHLDWQLNDIAPWNEQLRSDLPQLVSERRQKVLADRDLDAFLEVPVVGRSNPSPTFAVDPPKTPRRAIASPQSADPAFTPEPAISAQGFNEILSEIESVTTAVQRLPRTFAPMPEESLRDVLLVVLNNRFGPASGETFSRKGKTDIFLPWDGDQRAVFIAECKWWRGPAAFRKAIEQLLGYLTWRDTHAALVVFVREGDPAEIADKAASELQGHSSFKRMEHHPGRDTFTLASSDDSRREIHIALLLIPVLP